GRRGAEDCLHGEGPRIGLRYSAGHGHQPAGDGHRLEEGLRRRLPQPVANLLMEGELLVELVDVEVVAESVEELRPVGLRVDRFEDHPLDVRFRQASRGDRVQIAALSLPGSRQRSQRSEVPERVEVEVDGLGIDVAWHRISLQRVFSRDCAARLLRRATLAWASRRAASRRSFARCRRAWSLVSSSLSRCWCLVFRAAIALVFSVLIWAISALIAAASSSLPVSRTSEMARRYTMPPSASIRLSTTLVQSSSTSAITAALPGERALRTSSTKSLPTRAVSRSEISPTVIPPTAPTAAPAGPPSNPSIPPIDVPATVAVGPPSSCFSVTVPSAALATTAEA